jgi:hypothetical protein
LRGDEEKVVKNSSPLPYLAPSPTLSPQEDIATDKFLMASVMGFFKVLH